MLEHFKIRENASREGGGVSIHPSFFARLGVNAKENPATDKCSL